MNKSKRLRLERHAYLTHRKYLEQEAQFIKEQERLTLLSELRSLGQEVDKELKQEVVV